MAIFINTEKNINHWYIALDIMVSTICFKGPLFRFLSGLFT